MRSVQRSILVCGSIWFLNFVFADSVNVNFQGVSSRQVTGTAGVLPAANWNNVTEPSVGGTRTNLNKDTGVASTVDMTWTADVQWFSNNSGTSQDAILMDGYLANQDQNYNNDVVITEIPYASYDIYIYFGTNNPGAKGKIRLNGSGLEYYYSSAGIIPDFPGFQQVISTDSGSPGDGNYVIFTNVTGSTLTIEQTRSDNGPDSGLMGFQIVDAGAPAPKVELAQVLYTTLETVVVDFSYGPGAAENNIAFVERGGDPATEVLTRLYVGGISSPTSGVSSGTLNFPNAGGLLFGDYDAYFLADTNGSTILDGPFPFEITLIDPSPVAVGLGSYAEYPPPHEGDGPIDTAFKQEIYVVDGVTSPIPTNDWWTDLLVSQYAGSMWAYPGVVSADNQGLNLLFPKAFNGDGSAMVLENAVEVFGEVVPDVDPTFILLADFEGATYPVGWTTEGTAFGSGPSNGTNPGQSQVSNFLGSGLVNSFLPNDGPTGKLISPDFTIQRDYIHFLIGGGNHPGSAAVELIVGGSPVLSSTGQNRENLRWERWDVNSYIGQTARIEIIDQETGGWGHILADHIFQSDDGSDPSTNQSNQFSPVDARAINWGDWTVAFRLAQTIDKYIDITIGHGLPYVWLESTNVDPILDLDSSALFFDLSGSNITLPQTSDYVGIEFYGNHYGVFLPDNTQIEFTSDQLRFTFAGADDYVVIAFLPDRASLSTFYSNSFAIPRESIMTWNYNKAAGKIGTRWTLQNEILKGSNANLIQCWIPHHYRTTTMDFSFNGIEYVSPRGLMKSATGTQFGIDWRFRGFVPNLPEPQLTGKANDYDPSYMAQILNQVALKTDYGAETYFGGKDLERFAKFIHIADEVDNVNIDTLKNTLKNALVDWLTYTPGETEHYYAYYPNWKGLVGFNESFFSYQFTDHHFHYGYLTLAVAMYSMFDPDFMTEYGEMAKLIAKEYANWDRNDTMFPYMRTFDLWHGHSYAGGFSSPGGNNQESSSEATQSWAGLMLLGAALEDDEIEAAGAMGYAIESHAIMEYWNDINGDIFSPNYNETITGILFDSGQAYATYFSGDPGWIYGIQWLPISPHLFYLVEDPAFAEQQWDAMVVERIAAEGSFDIDAIGSALGNVLLGYELLFDQDSVAAQLDTLIAGNSSVVTDYQQNGYVYYYTHALRSLGEIDWDVHFSVSTASAFTSSSGQNLYAIYNFKATAESVSIYRNGSYQFQTTVPARTLVLITDGNESTTESSHWALY